MKQIEFQWLQGCIQLLDGMALVNIYSINLKMLFVRANPQIYATKQKLKPFIYHIFEPPA